MAGRQVCKVLLCWLTPDRVVLGAGHLVTMRKHLFYHVWLDAEGPDEGTSHITCLKGCEADLVLLHALLFASELLVLNLTKCSGRCWEWGCMRASRAEWLQSGWQLHAGCGSCKVLIQVLLVRCA